MGKRFGKYIRFLFDGILDVIYGDIDECSVCGQYSDGYLLCRECGSRVSFENISGKLEREKFSFDFYCCSYYDIIIKELIIKLKYKSDFRAGSVLVELLKKACRELELKIDLLTFVPSSAEAYEKRGYNPTEFLCRKLSVYEELKVINCLQVNKVKADQIGLDGNERWGNLKEAFYVKTSKEIKNKNIVLIDDVITTGATAFYCCKALMQAGAAQVIVLTVAKSTI